MDAATLLASLSPADRGVAQESLNFGAKPQDVWNWFQTKAKDPNAIAQGQAQWEQDPNKYGTGSGLVDLIRNGNTGKAFFDLSTDEGAASLKQLKAFDPNAHWDENTGQISYDPTKLPKWTGGSQYLPYLNKGMVNMATDSAAKRVQDPSKIIHDPVYGSYTPNTNLSVSEGDSNKGFMGQLGKYAPSVISAIMSAGYGAAAGPLAGALLSGTLGPNGVGQHLAMGDKMDWGKTAINMGTSALTGWAGGQLGDITKGLTQGLDPWAQSLAKQGVNAGLGAAGKIINGQNVDSGNFATEFAKNYAASLIPGGNTALSAYNMFKQING